MPRFQTENGQYYAPPELVRFIKPIKGSPQIQIQYDPRLEYAQGKTIHKEKLLAYMMSQALV